jgi:3'-5' exoribonuclease
VKELFIETLASLENQTVTGFFVAGTRQLRTKTDGSAYLAVTLLDRTGQLEGRMWEAAEAGEFHAGDVIKLRGQVCRYQEKLQIKIDKLRRADPAADANEFEFGDFVPKTQYDTEELWTRLEGYVASFTDPDLKQLLTLFLTDPEIGPALREAPAAKTMHHAWIGGLLEHVVSLLDICSLTATHYREDINRDLLLTGAILHDIGKLVELRWGTSFDYTLKGQLLGHISIGLAMVEQKAALVPSFPPKLLLLVQHIILSHHGRYEFGSPKLPMIPEALLLHYLDDLEAKMQTMRSEFKKAIDSGRKQGTLTDWIRALERPILETRSFLLNED